VGEAERWFNHCSQGEALALVDDLRIRRLIGREFPEMGLTPTQMIKAGQITGDDILFHYGKALPDEVKATKERPSLGQAEGMARVAPVYIKLLEHHWDRLREQSIAFRTQLSPPTIETLFAAEVCHKAYNAVQSGAPLLPSSSWSRVFDAPFDLRTSGSVTGGTIEVRLLVEEEFLFPHLVSHLEAEPSQFTQFGDWKEQLGRLVQLCLERAENISRSCCLPSGMYYLGRNRQKGLSWHFPAYVCQFILSHLHLETAPRFHTEPRSDGLWVLMPEEFRAITLAVDTRDHIDRDQEVLVKQVKDNVKIPVWQQISHALIDLKINSDQLQATLTTIIERGNFKGTCSLCEEYFPPSQSA
jgi:hypothetical protein